MKLLIFGLMYTVFYLYLAFPNAKAKIPLDYTLQQIKSHIEVSDALQSEMNKLQSQHSVLLEEIHVLFDEANQKIRTMKEAKTTKEKVRK